MPLRISAAVFFLLVEGVGGGGYFDESIPARFFFFLADINTRIISSTLLATVSQSTVAQPVETIVAECSLASCV